VDKDAPLAAKRQAARRKVKKLVIDPGKTRRGICPRQGYLVVDLVYQPKEMTKSWRKVYPF